MSSGELTEGKLVGMLLYAEIMEEFAEGMKHILNSAELSQMLGLPVDLDTLHVDCSECRVKDGCENFDSEGFGYLDHTKHDDKTFREFLEEAYEEVADEADA